MSGTVAHSRVLLDRGDGEVTRTVAAIGRLGPGAFRSTAALLDARSEDLLLMRALPGLPDPPANPPNGQKPT
ncbi:hypothetical protein ACFC6U_18865 [Kitasatospora purpeofusca]|uniref:hypothetical protein n=1 Tax=Kitasatospora purpeofusca TaxID=67352 RepID=UPI0035DA0DB9